MGSLIGELRREAAARAEPDRLRSRIEERSLSGTGRAEEEFSRLAIARSRTTRTDGRNAIRVT